MSNKYPLRLEPQLKEVVWGGQWLVNTLGRPGSTEARLGESWEAFGGSRVSNGEWAGRTLGELFEQHRPDWLGAAVEAYPKFPLLVKFIDAKQNLSVQVHPDDGLARQLENYPFGKTEFWYIIEAEPGAAIRYGLNSDATDRVQLQAAISQQDLLRYTKEVPVRAGDVVFIPAGTVHALTRGIVVYELQQDSDITYRLYDWGRTDRPIHIEKGLQAINFEYKDMAVTHPEPTQAEGYQHTRLVASAYFRADLYRVTSRANPSAVPGSFSLLSVLDGVGQLSSPDGIFDNEPLGRGDTLLVPAGLDFGLETNDGLEVINGYLVG